MSHVITTFDEIREILKKVPKGCNDSALAKQEREDQLTKPQGALGDLEDYTKWIAKWQGRAVISLARPRVAVFAGNHGVAKQGVSLFPVEVTQQMVLNFQHGGAAVNQLCKTYDAELRIYEMNLEQPTNDFTSEPAMSEADCINAICYGMTSVEEGIDILCVGEMGIANTTSGSAIAHALFGGEASDWVGPGTGVSGEALTNKIRVVQEGVAKHKSAMTDGLEILRHLGGFELCAIVGAIVAARMGRVPVIIDGYTTTSAASILYAIDKSLLDHCMIGHLSAEPSHTRLLDVIGQKAMVNFNMRLGEGTGAVIALGILKGAVACHNDMATFAEAGISS